MTPPEGPYNSIVMDHLTHPRNMGEMENPDAIGEATNPACGDTMRLFIRVSMGQITEATSLTYGCGAAIAASSMATEMLRGKSLAEALKITNQAVADALGGLPPTKLHCSVLVRQAIQAAVSDYRKSRGG